MILKSMNDAIADLTKRLGNDPQKWEWGKVHTMTIKNPLGSVLPFLNLNPMPHPGDDWTINSGYWVKANPFDMLEGGAIRIVVDMSDISTMTLISPAGQSGHYLSPYYSDQAELWNNGQQIPTHYTDAMELKQVLVLKP
jgi:penicillin amidase